MMLFSYVALLSYLPLLTFGRKRGTKALTQPLAQWLCSTVYARGLWASKLHRGERDGAEAAVDFAEVVRCHAAAAPLDGPTGGGHTFSLLGSANGLPTWITG